VDFTMPDCAWSDSPPPAGSSPGAALQPMPAAMNMQLNSVVFIFGFLLFRGNTSMQDAVR
jgi:hypothetical protein